MTVETSIQQFPPPGPRSLTDDIQTLGALAGGDDFAAFEAFCRIFEAAYPTRPLAMLHRCRMKERLSGARAAAADAAESWTKYQPTPGLVRFLVNLMCRAGDFAGARGALDALRDEPDLAPHLRLMEWQIAVESEDCEAIQRLLAEDPGDAQDAQADAWKAVGLLVLQRPVDALSRMLDAIGLTNQPALLLPALRRFTGNSRHVIATALSTRLNTEESLEVTDSLLLFTANALVDCGRIAEAMPLLQRVCAADGPAADRAHMIASQLAASLGDAPAAREHLAALILRHCPPPLAREMMATLGHVMFDWRGPQTIMRLLARMPQFRQEAGAAATALDLVQGRFDAVIEDFFRHDPVERLKPGILFPFGSACIENSRWDDLLRGVRSLPLDGPLSAQHLRRLRAMLSCVDDPALTRPVTLALLTRIPADSHEALMLRLETAGAGEVEDAARDALRLLQAGNPAVSLRLALCCEGEGLFGHLSADLAGALRQQGIDRIDLTDISQGNQTWSQRHLCKLIQAGFPEPRPEAVSIIAPVHRACDLPNLRANLARQRWSNLEAIVVANGELHESPLVAQALAGLPNVTILHDREKNVGSYLNLAVAHASGDIVMRFDADDVYFAEYVSTSVRALQATDGEVAGKHSCFVWFEGARRVFLRNPAPFYNEAQNTGYYGVGATHVVRRDVFRDIRYLESVVRGEDYLFFENCNLRGLRNINLDPFNYLIVRRQDKAAHTWQVDDLGVLGGGICYIGGPEVVPLIAAPDAAAEAIPLAGL